MLNLIFHEHKFRFRLTRITETMVDEGQYVGAGRAVASVFSTDVAEVRLPLTGADIAALGVPIGYEADGVRVYGLAVD